MGIPSAKAGLNITRPSYGNFTIETPVSFEMASFLAKAKHPYQFTDGEYSSWRDYVDKLSGATDRSLGVRQ